MNINNKIQQFNDEEFGALDILVINDIPFFPAVACATILGYSTPRHAVTRHCKGGTKRAVPTNGGIQQKIFIPESDLYRLIVRSKLPSAVRFEEWVFDEVLPTIRKHGAYATNDTLNELKHNPDFSETLIKRLEKERQEREVLEELAADMAPKARYCDVILQCRNVVPISLIAKDYGMSAIRFNTMLHGFGIQFRSGGTWVLYQKYAMKGYTKTRTYHIGEYIAAIHTCWTQKGRLFLYEFLKNFSILPVMDSRYDDPLPA